MTTNNDAPIKQALTKLHTDMQSLTTPFFKNPDIQGKTLIIAKCDDKQTDHPPYCLTLSDSTITYVEGQETTDLAYTYSLSKKELSYNKTPGTPEDISCFFKKVVACFNALEANNAILYTD